MRVKKFVLMFAVIAVLLIIILGRPITTDAPQIMGSKEIEDALNAASELDEQNVVRVDIPDGNGGYKTLQGEEAREHYSKAVEQTQKELLDDLYKENSKKSIKWMIEDCCFALDILIKGQFSTLPCSFLMAIR